MCLERYLQLHHMTPKQFAVWVNVGLSRVYSWLHGTVPRPAMVQKIFELTNGEIDGADWFRCGGGKR
jgi:predicted transcriptional regulator